ncbi:calcium-binding protein [Falsirhodobacter xinxiangensis]|uniref:calcium-binding protein n=1 Tax=Falsirhodobacter xinxiangensis TaxID=2530049 RepID=UPI0010A9A6B4|nr:hypothetical protein [Rhodobacter xinxiangensis]
MADFLVNTLTDRSQDRPDVAVLADGSFVVVWASDYYNSDRDIDVEYIAMQRYSASGARIGNETIVSDLAYEAEAPSVTALPDGGFAISWEAEEGPTDIDTRIRSRVVNADGTFRSAEVNVSQAAREDDEFDVPQMAPLANGGYITLFAGDDGDTFTDVFVRVMGADGKPASQYRLNTTTEFDQSGVQAARLTNGNVVAVWDSDHSTVNEAGNEVEDVRARIIGANGQPITPEIVISRENDGMTNWLGASYPVSHLAVEGLDNGRFVVTWRETWLDALPNGDTAHLYRGQVFTASGQAVGKEFTVNTGTPSDIPNHAVITRLDGGFFVAWDSAVNPNDPYEDIRGQYFTNSGARVDGEFTVATRSANAQEHPAVETLADGRLVVTWQTDYTYTDSVDVAARIIDPGQVISIGRDGTAGNDVMAGTFMKEVIRGAAGNDKISGKGGNDTLLGGSGSDRMDGGAGHDILGGEWGNDLLMGGDGSDRMVGGFGNDIMVGGAGADRFVFHTGHGKDRITDFTPGRDVLDFSTVTTIADFADLRANHAVQDGDDIVIRYGAAAVRLEDVRMSALDADDFLF